MLVQLGEYEIEVLIQKKNNKNIYFKQKTTSLYEKKLLEYLEKDQNLIIESRYDGILCEYDLLIASHIKPFRDCGYTVEAMDSNNGLLLCRNHDYLFDQGYFSFDDDGHLLMSDELARHKPFSAFHITKNLVLPKRYLSQERKAFLAYHRQHIFKK